MDRRSARGVDGDQTVRRHAVHFDADPVPCWLVGPGAAEGIGAGIAKRSEPWQTVTPTIEVASADDNQRKIIEAGGTIIVPKPLIPGVGKLVTFKDTEGNIMAILEPDQANPFVPPSS